MVPGRASAQTGASSTAARVRQERPGQHPAAASEHCKAHGGGKCCNFGGGCEKFARGWSGLCAAHATLVASQQRRCGAVAGMIGPAPTP